MPRAAPKSCCLEQKQERSNYREENSNAMCDCGPRPQAVIRVSALFSKPLDPERLRPEGKGGGPERVFSIHRIFSPFAVSRRKYFRQVSLRTLYHKLLYIINRKAKYNN